MKAADTIRRLLDDYRTLTTLAGKGDGLLAPSEAALASLVEVADAARAMLEAEDGRTALIEAGKRNFVGAASPELRFAATELVDERLARLRHALETIEGA